VPTSTNKGVARFFNGEIPSLTKVVPARWTRIFVDSAKRWGGGGVASIHPEVPLHNYDHILSIITTLSDRAAQSTKDS